MLHVEDSELEAVELLLKCLYKAGLPEEAHGDGGLLLQVYILADKYAVPAQCMEPIIAALSALEHQVDLGLLGLRGYRWAFGIAPHAAQLSRQPH